MRAHLVPRAVLVCLCAELIGCGAGPQVGRVGPAVGLPQGQPRSPCERKNWYEIAPTRVQTTTARGGGYVTYHYSQMNEGIGVFRVAEEDPEDLEDLWLAMKEPALQRDHEARIEPVDDANREALFWFLGGLTGMVIGLGTAAAIQDESGTGAAVAGISGLVIGIGGVIGGFAAMPSAEEELAADARRQLFIQGEDDLFAVARGIDRANAQQRRRCGGQPNPFEVAAPARTEPAAASKAPPKAVAPIQLKQETQEAPQAPPAAPEPAAPPAQEPPTQR